MCKHNPYASLELKGLCPGSLIDRHYQPISDLRDSTKLSLEGLIQMSVTYDTDEELWILSMATSDLTAISKTSHAMAADNS